MKITERESETAIDIQLAGFGWQLNPRCPARNVFKQQARTKDQNEKLIRRFPDYVLYAFEDSDKPTLVIEAKNPKKSMVNALEQAKEYAEKIEAPLVVATDGWRVKTWHRGFESPLFIDGREVDELFSPEMSRRFAVDNHFNSFSKEVPIEQGELISKFKKANDILKGEGFSAGVERFSEFANLMFLKLKFEGGEFDGKTAVSGWSEIENKSGASLFKSIKNTFSDLRRTSKLFEQTQIRSPKNMERLIEILSSFRLSSVKGDIKGMAFEHFIHSYTRGTKNDLGQYFTPRHIVRMMVHFLKPQIGETIYDPFCGTGGMLIECFRYIRQRINKAGDKQMLREKTLFGRDNSSVARIAMMNMIMFGDGHSNIWQGDSYSLLGKTKHEYDIVMTNIPFSQHTDYTEGYPVFPKGGKSGDSIGVQHCLESLKKDANARAAIIVPIGFLYKTELREERHYIFENWNLERIVELSPKCFQPYTEQQTAVLVINREKSRSKFPYYRIANDGYSQDGYRVPLPGENDIDRAMDNEGASFYPVEAEGACKFKYLNLIIYKNSIRLGDVAKIRSGSSNISPKTKIDDVCNGIYPVMMVADLAKKHIDYSLTESAYKLTERAIEKKKPHLFPKNTILIPVTGKASLKNHRALLGCPAYATSTLVGIEAKHIHSFCLFHFFLNFNMEQITYDLGYPGISTRTLSDIHIPDYTDKDKESIIARVSECVMLSNRLKEKHKETLSPAGIVREMTGQLCVGGLNC